MFWKVLRYAGSLTDCNCSWSDIFPLSARTSMEGANFMSPKIWIWLRFPRCISPSGWSTEDLQAALYASMKIFFEWAGNLWPFSRVWDMKFESCWTVERQKLWEMSIYYSTLTQAKHFDIFHRKYWLSSSELGASWLSSVQKRSRCNRPSPFAGV